MAASTLGLMAIATLNAGQIQIGGTSGLTSSYALGSTVCSGATSYTPGTFTGCLFTGRPHKVRRLAQPPGSVTVL